MNNNMCEDLSMMNWYLNICCMGNLLRSLECFSQGIGYQHGEIIMIFGDDLDENNPELIRDYPELAGYKGVGFYSDHFPSPLLVNYQDFYNKLECAVEKVLVSKDVVYQQKARKYLEKIKMRYQLE